MLRFRCHFKSCANGKETVPAVPCNLTSAKVACSAGSQGTGRSGRDIAKRLMNGKANGFALLKRITNLKVSIPMSSSPTVTHKGVASSSSMAPCRSHHGYYTRQNWIFEGIHQELSPLTRKLDGKQINLRIRIIEVLRNVHRDQNRHQIV